MAGGRYTDDRGRIRSAFVERAAGADQTPYSRRLPEPAEIIGQGEAWYTIGVLQEFGIGYSWNEMIADQARWLERVSSIAPGDPRWEEELARITTGPQFVRGLARRMRERYTTLEGADGNPEQQFIRISEGDENVCDECFDREGAEGTLAEHEAIGLPGAASCLGGASCRCTLTPIS